MAPHNLTLNDGRCSAAVGGLVRFQRRLQPRSQRRRGDGVANTLFATAAAVLWTFAEWMTKGKPSMLGAASGAVAGLVAITPACGFVGVIGGVVIGAAAGGFASGASPA